MKIFLYLLSVTISFHLFADLKYFDRVEKELFEKRDYETLIPILKEGKESNDSKRFFLAYYLFRRGKYKEAISVLDKIEEKNLKSFASYKLPASAVSIDVLIRANSSAKEFTSFMFT